MDGPHKHWNTNKCVCACVRPPYRCFSARASFSFSRSRSLSRARSRSRSLSLSRVLRRPPRSRDRLRLRLWLERPLLRLRDRRWRERDLQGAVDGVGGKTAGRGEKKKNPGVYLNILAGFATEINGTHTHGSEYPSISVSG